MTIYLLIIEDRHCDVEVRCFTDVEVAIAAAREVQQRYREDGNDEDVEEEVPPPDGWLHHCILSCEGDALRVEACDVEVEA